MTYLVSSALTLGINMTYLVSTWDLGERKRKTFGKLIISSALTLGIVNNEAAAVFVFVI